MHSEPYEAKLLSDNWHKERQGKCGTTQVSQISLQTSTDAVASVLDRRDAWLAGL